MRLNGIQRLLIVMVATAIAVWLLWPPYRDALEQISQQLNNNNSGRARAADGMPRHYLRRQCTGSIWSDDPQCGPWQDDGMTPGGRR